MFGIVEILILSFANLYLTRNRRNNLSLKERNLRKKLKLSLKNFLQ